MGLKRGCFSLLLLAAALAACHGAGAPLTPASSGGLAARAVLPAPGGSAVPKTALAVTLAIAKPALAARTLELYAYPLSWRGPLASPPRSALALTASVANGASGCSATAGGRSCSLSAMVPNASDAFVAVLRGDKNAILGQAFVAIDLLVTPGPTSTPIALALAAGKARVTNLTVTPPLSLQGGSFNVGVTAFSNGPALLTNPNEPTANVTIYGPAGVVPSPSATVSGSGGTAAFAYAGTPFVNAMTVAAQLGTSTNTAQIFPQHKTPLACAPLSNTTTFTIGEPPIFPNGFTLHAAVAGGQINTVGLDTGSTSFLIAKSLLGKVNASQLIGPGQAAIQKYEPSGLELKGHYYLAPVTLYAGKNHVRIGTTVPMEVFVTDTRCQTKTTHKCQPDTTTSYMGVGFGRPVNQPGLLSSPLESTFMQLAAIVQGTMHPGFGLSKNTLAIGVNPTTASGFSTVKLDPYTNRPGDWFGPAGCLRFNGTGGYDCGRLLLDIGINTMFITTPGTPNPLTQIEVVSPSQKRPLLKYSFDYPVAPGATPPAPNPKGNPPIGFTTSTRSTFVNTGRNVLAVTDYYYDAGCGQAGFRKISP